MVFMVDATAVILACAILFFLTIWAADEFKKKFGGKPQPSTTSFPEMNAVANTIMGMEFLLQNKKNAKKENLEQWAYQLRQFQIFINRWSMDKNLTWASFKISSDYEENWPYSKKKKKA